MKKVINEYYCDVCGKKIDKGFLKNNYEENEAGDYSPLRMTVIFTTEQTEGRSAGKSYLYMEKLYLCQECYDKVFKEGKQIFAAGAMGINDYWFLDGENKNGRNTEK